MTRQNYHGRYYGVFLLIEKRRIRKKATSIDERKKQGSPELERVGN